MVFGSISEPNEAAITTADRAQAAPVVRVAPAPRPEFRVWDHMKMLADRERVGFFKRAINLQAAGRWRFCEIGCGTGVFSIHAATIFDQVVAVERDPALLSIARANVKRLGLSDKIRLIEAEGASLGAAEIGGPADLIFLELLAPWLMNEQQVAVTNHALQHLLAPGGAIIPYGFTGLIELGWVDFDFGPIEVKAPFPELAALRPLQLLSTSVVAFSADLRQPNASQASGSAELPVVADGAVNCVRLSSVAHLAPGVSLSGTDSVMPSTVVPLPKAAEVRRGQTATVSYSFAFGERVETAQFALQVR